jgi:sugar (pentulose or hexulose) kinase
LEHPGIVQGKAVIVIDIGKTLAKATLWDAHGTLIARETRPNERVDCRAYTGLDINGIDAWLGGVLADFAKRGDVGAIVPVAHGAAAVLIRDGQVVVPPMDYETAIPADILDAYRARRSHFAETGSPALPDGLNLGAQLHWLEALHPSAFENALILPWGQYWAWRLSGVAATETTALGCHTDLWNPASASPSSLAVDAGWADRFPPLRAAADMLGTVTPEWVARTGLPADTRVHCGIHDSNAALMAARGFAEIAGHEATVLSTGTWFVAMRTPGEAVDLAWLPEARDCLVNVDAFGKTIPSARFMGGREIEMLTGVDARRIDIRPDQSALLACVADIVARGTIVLPTFAPGFGPFPDAHGRWINLPDDGFARRAAVCLYAALVADVALDLIGAGKTILIEGRFAEAEVFTRALASLRPDDAIYTSHAHNDVSFGALRLLDPDLKPLATLDRVAPLDVDLADYSASWHALTRQPEPVA